MSEQNNLVEVSKLICEKIEKAIGFLFDPNGRKKQAEEQFVAEIKEKNIPTLEKSALISNVRKIIKEYTNQNDILKLALQDFNSENAVDSSKIDHIDDEFLSRFFESAKHITSDNIKLIWARILSNEFSNPGSVPKRLIPILSVIEYKQADLFRKICQYTIICDDKVIPIIDTDFELEHFIQKGMYYESFLDLVSLGLISFNANSSNHIKFSFNNSIRNTTFKQTCKHFNQEFEVKTKNIVGCSKEISIDVGKILFTDSGLALMKSFDVDYSYEAFKYIIRYFENQGFDVCQKNKTIRIKHSTYKVSAGHGFYLNDIEDWEEIEVPDTLEARRADFSLTISGDSMEPIYSDGEIVLVKSQPSIDVGEIGIFVFNGSGYIKQNGGDRLISLNPEYDDIYILDGDTVMCAGKVIGKA